MVGGYFKMFSKNAIKKRMLIVPLLFFLSGCVGSGGGTISLPAAVFVDGATDMAPVIAEASVGKEAVVHKSIQNYHKQYAKAFKDSGTTVKFELMEVSKGVFVQVVSSISSRGEVDMMEPPSVPSNHPVWSTVNNVLDKALTYGFGYLAVDTVVGGFEALGKGAGNNFMGDADTDSSFNLAEDDLKITSSAPVEFPDPEPINLTPEGVW